MEESEVGKGVLIKYANRLGIIIDPSMGRERRWVPEVLLFDDNTFHNIHPCRMELAETPPNKANPKLPKCNNCGSDIDKNNRALSCDYDKR